MWFGIIAGIIILLIIVFVIKNKIDELKSEVDSTKNFSKSELSNLMAKEEKEITNLKTKQKEVITNLKANQEKEITILKAKQKKEYSDLEEHYQTEINKRDAFINNLGSNLTAFPYLAGIVADIETYGYEKLALDLEWGYDSRRLKKVADIREIRKEARAQIKAAKESQYQLQYLFQLYPGLEEIVDIEFSELPQVDLDKLDDKDRTRDYLSKEEYYSLSDSERNQLALDRYLTSHKKTKWQIGRDYENYIGYIYEHEKKYKVEYFGSLMRLEDLGRDLIAKKDGIVLIIQCKYWSKEKQIHEKHIYQLYGTTISYCIEKNLRIEDVTGLLITNITLSDTAKKMANYLGIVYKENVPLKEYPCIKCNIGKDATKIYHLPFDQQYDKVKINKPGEFFAYTVKEAEDAGFRRAFKWHNNK